MQPTNKFVSIRLTSTLNGVAVLLAYKIYSRIVHSTCDYRSEPARSARTWPGMDCPCSRPGCTHLPPGWCFPRTLRSVRSVLDICTIPNPTGGPQIRSVCGRLRCRYGWWVPQFGRPCTNLPWVAGSHRPYNRW